MVTSQSHHLHPLCRFAALPPKGAARKASLQGELAAPTGLTCAPAGAMQASNRRQAALSESQRGCGRHPQSYKIPGEFAQPPWLPPGGSQGRPVRIRPSLGKNVTTHRTPQPLRRQLSSALSGCTPSRTATPAKPFRGAWGVLGSPVGGAGRLDGTSDPARLTEGVWFDEWQQLKITNGTPFAAARHETEV